MIDDVDEPGDGVDPFHFISTDCPSCGSRLKPLSTSTGNVYLRCQGCGTAAI